MKKFALTQKGIRRLQEKIYALDDRALALEVLKLRTQFKDWIEEKFELDQDETAFIRDLNEQFTIYAAVKLSKMLAQRKQITFNVIEFKTEKID